MIDCYCVLCGVMALSCKHCMHCRMPHSPLHRSIAVDLNDWLGHSNPHSSLLQHFLFSTFTARKDSFVHRKYSQAL
jgi:hypothetical protein